MRPVSKNTHDSTTLPPGTLVDLSQPIANGMFHSRRNPGPEILQVSSVDVDKLSVTHASFIVHSGTHVDAPTHFFPKASPLPKSHSTASSATDS